MPELTIAEEVVLIALDSETGGGKMRLGLDWAVAGAIIVELALIQRITLGDNDIVTVLEPVATGVGHLDAVLADIADGVKVSKALRRARGGAPDRTIAALVDRGVLHRRRTWLLGMVPAHRYPLKETSVATGIRVRLTATVLKGHDPDERTAALIGVLHAAKLWQRAVPTGERKRIRERMGSISQGQAISPAVRKAIVRTQVAIAAMAAASSSH
ncbi:GPP34 family phosphoprotein [Amycolatopsis sp. NPDC089917]|uniref:GOLPH3/VPS74 family protein n=1 Tax=Amycolatopsis sp. NPDC089917 TaxID=3155187 RepID=UPI0034405A76